MIDPFSTQVVAARTGPGSGPGSPGGDACERTATSRTPQMPSATSGAGTSICWNGIQVGRHENTLSIRMISSGDLYDYMIGYLMILIKCLALITYCPSNICII